MKRILIIRSGNIGDTIWATAIMDALIDAYGQNIHIDWLAKNFAINLFEYDPRVNNVYPLNHRRIPIFLSKEKCAIIRHSKKKPYDTLINIEFADFLQPLIKKIQAKQKIDIFDYIKTLKQPQPAVDIFIELIKKHCNLPAEKKYYPKLYPNKSILKKTPLPKSYLCLSPATSNSAKNRNDNRIWPIQYWRELILNLEKNYTLFILGGPQDTDYINKLGELPKTVNNLVGKTRLNESFYIIKQAALLIAADTGTIHMAAALETPLIGIYGPSNAYETGPFVKKSHLAAVFSCYLDNGYGPYLPDTPKEASIKTITPEMIAEQVRIMVPAP